MVKTVAGAMASMGPVLALVGFVVLLFGVAGVYLFGKVCVCVLVRVYVCIFVCVCMYSGQNYGILWALFLRWLDS